MECPPDHARFDRLAQPDLIGQQKPPPRAGNDAVGGENLVRQNFGPRVGKLPALVAGEQSGREHFEFEAPGRLPLATGGAVQGRINLFHLGKQ